MTRAILKKIVDALPDHGLTIDNLIREDEWIGDSQMVKKFRHSLRIQGNVRFKDQDADDNTSGKVLKEEFLRAYVAEEENHKSDRERHHTIVKEREEWKTVRVSRAKATRKDLKEGTVVYKNLDEKTLRILRKQREVDNKQQRI